MYGRPFIELHFCALHLPRPTLFLNPDVTQDLQDRFADHKIVEGPTKPDGATECYVELYPSDGYLDDPSIPPVDLVMWSARWVYRNYFLARCSMYGYAGVISPYGEDLKLNQRYIRSSVSSPDMELVEGIDLDDDDLDIIRKQCLPMHWDAATRAALLIKCKHTDEEGHYSFDLKEENK